MITPSLYLLYIRICTWMIYYVYNVYKPIKYNLLHLNHVYIIWYVHLVFSSLSSSGSTSTSDLPGDSGESLLKTAESTLLVGDTGGDGACDAACSPDVSVARISKSL